MPSHSTEHGTFRIDRTLPAAPPAVFAAFANQTAKARWFAGPDDASSTDHVLDFRVGGRERLTTTLPDGPAFIFDAEYRDIVPDARIVYVYDMTQDAARLSVSVATIELEPDGAGTHLTVTEQGVYLDGRDTMAQRERGTHQLLDQLEASLTGSTAGTAGVAR